MRIKNTKKQAQEIANQVNNPASISNTVNMTGLPVIKLFTVMANFDPNRSGTMIAVETREDHEQQDNDILYNIFYTSPYLAGEHAGLVMVPEVGTQVLAVKPVGTNRFFFMSCVLKKESSMANYSKNSGDLVKKKEFLPGGNENYEFRGIPQQYSISSPKGNKLVLSDRNSPDKWDTGIKLETGEGKGLNINSSPHVDCVELHNEHNDYLRLTSEPVDGIDPVRGLTANVFGGIMFHTKTGDASYQVGKGGNALWIENKSNGISKSSEDNTDESPGMLNIKSLYRDVNITAQRGSIFIQADKYDEDTANVVVEVMSNGEIGLHAASAINIKCTDPAGRIYIDSPSAIDVKSGGTLNIESTKDMNLKSGGDFSVSSGGTVYINGSPDVHLNKLGVVVPGADGAANRYKGFYERILENGND